MFKVGGNEEGNEEEQYDQYCDNDDLLINEVQSDLSRRERTLPLGKQR